MQRAGQRPPVEHRELRVEQAARVIAQRFGLLRYPIVALQHGHVADGIGDVREDLMIVPLDICLASPGLLHHQTSDRDIEHAEHEQHQRHAQVHGDRSRDEQEQRHRSRQMRAHEFQPKAEQGLNRTEQRMQCVGSATLLVPRERHGDDALEGLAKHGDAAGMRQPIGAPRHENESDDVEDSEADPKGQGIHQVVLFGDRVDDLSEQDRLGDHNHAERDICRADQGHLLPFGSEIPQCSPVDLKQRHASPSCAGYCALQQFDRSSDNAAVLQCPQTCRVPKYRTKDHNRPISAVIG